MTTTPELPDLHTAAGARWLAGVLAMLLATLLLGVLMVVHLHVTG